MPYIDWPCSISNITDEERERLEIEVFQKWAAMTTGRLVFGGNGETLIPVHTSIGLLIARIIA